MIPTRIAEAKRLVIKVGSALVTNNGQGLDVAAIDEWARQIALLRGDGKQVVLAVQHDREWTTFCDKVLQLPDLTAQYLGNANRLAQREK